LYYLSYSYHHCVTSALTDLQSTVMYSKTPKLTVFHSHLAERQRTGRGILVLHIQMLFICLWKPSRHWCMHAANALPESSDTSLDIVNPSFPSYANVMNFH